MIALGEETVCASCRRVVVATVESSSNLTVLRSTVGETCADGSLNHDWPNEERTTLERMPKTVRTYRVVVESALGVGEFETFTDDASAAWETFEAFRIGTTRTVRVECRSDPNEAYSIHGMTRNVIAISSGRKA